MLPAAVLTMLPFRVQSPVACMLNVAVPRSVRFAIPENVPERFVTVPAFEPFSVQVAPVAFSVPAPVSVRLSNDVQLKIGRVSCREAVAPVIVEVAFATYSVPVPVSCRLQIDDIVL